MGVEVANVITGRPDGVSQDDYLAERAGAFYREFIRRGYSAAQAVRALPAFLAICCLETGCGRSEHNYNVANLRWFQRLQGPPPGNYVNIHTHIGMTLPFRAYTSLDDGVRDFVGNMLVPRYRAATERLLADGDAESWYHAITTAGYTTPTPELWATYRGVLRRLHFRLPPPRAGRWLMPWVLIGTSVLVTASYLGATRTHAGKRLVARAQHALRPRHRGRLSSATA